MEAKRLQDNFSRSETFLYLSWNDAVYAVRLLMKTIASKDQFMRKISLDGDKYINLAGNRRIDVNRRQNLGTISMRSKNLNLNNKGKAQFFKLDVSVRFIRRQSYVRKGSPLGGKMHEKYYWREGSRPALLPPSFLSNVRTLTCFRSCLNFLVFTWEVANPAIFVSNSRIC